MEIKINVVNEVRKLRTNTYSDKYTWIDELVQNCQRAMATIVTMAITENSFTIEDNGCGCVDPSVLFTKSQTGWDESISSQKPFGEGLFSTIILANKVELESIDFKATLDVKAILERGEIDCITVVPCDRKSGFKATLSDFEKVDYLSYYINNRVEQVCKNIPQISWTLNGKAIETQDPSTIPAEYKDVAIAVNEDEFFGWIAPISQYYKKVELFAQQRHVKPLERFNYCAGVVSERNSINLRSPDRKDVVNDELWASFSAKLLAVIKKQILNLLKKSSNDLEDSVEKYLSPDEYASLLDFQMLDNNALKSRVVSAKVQPVDQYITGTSCEKPKKPKTFKIDPDVAQFWVAEKDIGEYADQISIAHYYGFPVITAKSTIHANALDYLKVSHVKNVGTEVQLEIQIKRVGPQTPQEERIDYILKQVGAHMEFPNIHIGDFECYHIFKNERKLFKAAGVYHNDMIYLSRKCIDTSGVRRSDRYEFFSVDKAFVCRNIDTLAHELTHALYGTVDNSKKHYEYQLKVTEKILHFLF